MSNLIPVISLIGRPNVGKSTLFNRIVRKGQKALTFDTPGVTRDRHYSIAYLNEKKNIAPCEIILVDTGGFYPDFHTDHQNTNTKKNTPEPFFEKMAEHGKVTVDESDLVLFVVDVREGLLPYDRLIINYIRSKNKKFWLLVNKFDSYSQSGDENVFWELGIKEEQLLLVSAEHAHGMIELREKLQMFSLDFTTDSKNQISKAILPNYDVVSQLAIIGLPNAGKSTLLNQLLEVERALVSDVAGTTMDPIYGYLDLYFGNKTVHLLSQEDEFRNSDKKILEELENLQLDYEDDEIEDNFENDDGNIAERAHFFEENIHDQEEEEVEPSDFLRSIKLIDTAGIKKAKNMQGYVETQAIYSALRSMSEADIVLHVLDVEKGITHQDRRLLDIAIEKGKSIIVVLNKVDLIKETMADNRKRKEWLDDLKYTIPWLSYCDLVPVSAKSGQHLKKLKDSIVKTIVVRNQKIPTAKLNIAVSELINKNPFLVPHSRGARLKVKYASLVKSGPPTILLVSNKSKGITDNYQRYLKNGLRDYFDFDNTPVHIIFRTTSEIKERAAKRDN
jgi:GTP-binding protein